MNPIYLELVNFRSHKRTAVDLSSVDSAVIIGKNGDGKSSIIYAMIYLLWGEVPDVATLMDLVSKGAKDMSVVMEFIHDDGAIYRIERGIKITGTKRKTANGYLTLSQKTADGKLNDISGNSIDATTQKISDLMGGLTYKTALYSNFNLQGESDKFMQARPSERRKLFEDILNLKPYETLEKAARAKSKEAKDMLRSLDYDDSKELSTEQAIKETEVTLQNLKRQAGIAQIGVESLVKSIKQLEIGMSEGTVELETKQQNLYVEITQLRNQSDACYKQLKECQVVIDIKEEIIAKYEALQTINRDFEIAGQNKQQYFKLSGERNVIATKLQAAENNIRKLEQDIVNIDAKLARRIAELCQQFAVQDTDLSSALTNAIVGLKTEQSNAQQVATTIRVQQSESQKSLEGVQAEIATLIAEIKAIDEQLLKIEKSGPLCPVFGRECGLLDKKNVAQEIEALQQTRKNKVDLGTQKKLVRTNIEEETKKLTQQLLTLNEQDKQYIQRINGAETSLRLFNELQAETQTVKVSASQALSVENGNMHALQTELTRLDADIAALGFNLAAFNQLEIQVNALRQQQWDVQYQKVLVAEEAVKGLNAKNADLGHRINLLGAEILEVATQIEQRRHEIGQIEPELNKQRNDLLTAKQELERLNKETASSSQQMGTLQAALDQIRTRKNTAILYQQQQIYYDSLVKAYQLARAMILESSTPRFQEFCNDCLDFLGINIRVRIETIEEVQDAKDKTTKYNPVFKIIVIDSEGDERDYATWSGGEKHRINIALRQGLAMTLLNRSGVKIGLVVIDEGDSKLDDSGKDALVQMIEATGQGRFGYAAKVLFVTHAADLKDRFTTRMLVYKDQAGSHVRIE